MPMVMQACNLNTYETSLLHVLFEVPNNQAQLPGGQTGALPKAMPSTCNMAHVDGLLKRNFLWSS